MSLLSRMMNMGKGLIRKASRAADEVIDELEANSGVEQAAAAHLERVRQRARDLDNESKDAENGVAKSSTERAEDDDAADKNVKNPREGARKRTL